jgi:transposase
MTKAYSMDLRRRIVSFVGAGHSRRSAATHFEVSAAFVVKLVAAFRRTGSYTPKPEGGWRYSKLDPQREFLLRRVSEKPDITMPELASELAATGLRIDPASLSRWFRRNGYRYKKNAAGIRTRSPRRSCRPRAMDLEAPTVDAARLARDPSSGLRV